MGKTEPEGWADSRGSASSGRFWESSVGLSVSGGFSLGGGGGGGG